MMLGSTVYRLVHSSTVMSHATMHLILRFGITATALWGSHVVAYDNMQRPFYPGNGFWPEPDIAAAQPFILGESNAIESTTIFLHKFGRSSNGSLYLDVWNDSGSNTPGEPVGSLGSIMATDISVGDHSYTFNENVSGLTPNQQYYLVLSMDGTNWSGQNNIQWVGPFDDDRGTGGAREAMAYSPRIGDWHTLRNLPEGGPPFPVWFYAKIDEMLQSTLFAGDADQDFDFDQLDLVQVQTSAKYLTGEIATWGEGDWDGAPGGSPGSPPLGNGLFDQSDIIAALSAGTYLTGPYASLALGGSENDEQTSLVYDRSTGELRVDAPSSTELTSIFVTSAGNLFVGDKPVVLDGPFDSFGPDNVFKSTIGGSFADSSFGNVLPAGLSEADVIADLSASGSLVGGGGLGEVDLVYVPEPASILLLSVGLAIGLLPLRRTNR